MHLPLNRLRQNTAEAGEEEDEDEDEEKADDRNNDSSVSSFSNARAHTHTRGKEEGEQGKGREGSVHDGLLSPSSSSSCVSVTESEALPHRGRGQQARKQEELGAEEDEGREEDVLVSGVEGRRRTTPSSSLLLSQGRERETYAEPPRDVLCSSSSGFPSCLDSSSSSSLRDRKKDGEEIEDGSEKGRTGMREENKNSQRVLLPCSPLSSSPPVRATTLATTAACYTTCPFTCLAPPPPPSSSVSSASTRRIRRGRKGSGGEAGVFPHFKNKAFLPDTTSTPVSTSTEPQHFPRARGFSPSSSSSSSSCHPPPSCYSPAFVKETYSEPQQTTPPSGLSAPTPSSSLWYSQQFFRPPSPRDESSTRGGGVGVLVHAQAAEKKQVERERGQMKIL